VSWQAFGSGRLKYRFDTQLTKTSSNDIISLRSEFVLDTLRVVDSLKSPLKLSCSVYYSMFQNYSHFGLQKVKDCEAVMTFNAAAFKLSSM
jgi:hypothetical protein